MKKVALLVFAMFPCMLHASDTSPYSGEDLRSIKSLSDQEVKSLRRGDGLGFAKLAELNHFPGPKHVLEISDELGLSASQLTSTKALYEEMRRRAVSLGNKLLLAESRLDQDFADESVNPQSLESALHEIGILRAELRYVHLESHLRQKQLLTPEQVSKYDTARGYRDGVHDHGDGSVP